MKTRTYQIAIASIAALCILLAGALAYVLTGHNLWPRNAAPQDPVVARGPEVDTHPTPPPTPSAADPALGPIQLSPQRLQEIGVTSTTAELKQANDDLTVPGNVNIDEEKISYVQSRFPGWIQDVQANATYQYVTAGQRLFTIYSPDIVSSQQEYLLAVQNEKAFAQDGHGMTTHESGWLQKAAEERLLQFGVPQKVISDLQQTGKVQRNIVVNSPVSGYITERNALPNAYVQPDTKLYTIADLSTVWVYANVSQNDVGRLKPGDSAQVSVDAYPGRKFNGRIDQILPQVDVATRTVRVRLVLHNPGVALKPGMYVNVAISVPLGKQLLLPSSAVMQTGTRAVVFIDHGGGSLEPRIVETGQQLDDSIVILNGLKPGERVVNSANFLVDSEAQLQAAVGAFATPAQQPSTSAPPAQQILIDMSTNPATPQKGANTVRVKLTGTDGKPLPGQQVNANFFMPAMPAMGMAAVHTTVAFVDKDSGLYEAPLQLQAGGTWQVSISVLRDGHSVATKHFTITATGGM